MDLDRIVSLLMKNHPDISADDAGQFLEEWIALIRESLLREDAVDTPHFGTFHCKPIGENKPTPPSADSGETAFFRIDFTPSDSLQKRVNTYFAHFEPTLLNEGVSFGELPVVKQGEGKKDELSENIVTRKRGMPMVEHTSATLPEPPLEETPNPLAASLQHLPDKSVRKTVERSRRRQTSKKSSSIWIPIIGGMAIVIAGLFFLHRDATGK